VRVVTLTTELGLTDWFVGVIKGVLFGLNPRVQIVDISHAIAPGDIRSGAFALASSYASFPRRTIHVAVVDPGVGGPRRAIAVEAGKYIFIGPDNGVLSLAIGQEKIQSMHWLEESRYFRGAISNTFHGRDIFAPVAGHISRGVPLSRLGPTAQELLKLSWPEPRGDRNTIHGQVIYLDHFGNAITNIRWELIESWPAQQIQIMAGRRRISEVSKAYQEVDAGSPVVVINSSGLLEIAVNRGNAAKALGLKIGSTVALRTHREIVAGKFSQPPSQRAS
jgi:S-adenosylmethionine hydrolase